MRVHQHLLRARRPEGRRPRPRPACAGAGLHEGRPVRPRRGRLPGAARARPSTPRRGWRCCRCTSARATGAPPPRWPRNWSAAAAARSPRASRTTGASWRCEADARGQTAAGRSRRCSARARPRRRPPRPLLLTGQRLARAGDHAQALQPGTSCWRSTRRPSPLVAGDYARSAAGLRPTAERRTRARCSGLYAAAPDIDLLQALARARRPTPAQRAAPAARTCSTQPTLSARGAAAGSCRPSTGTTDDAAQLQQRGRARRAAAAALPLRRLRLRGPALLLAMPGLPGLGQLPAAAHGGAVTDSRRRAHRAVHEVGHQVRPRVRQPPLRHGAPPPAAATSASSA